MRPLGSGYTGTRERMGSRPPLGRWVPKQEPSPRPGRRMAQEAFEAYGKSSPLPALPHHPFPPGYVPPPVSMGTGGSRHGTLSTMRRRGDYRQGATAAGDPGVRSLYHGEGREGPKEKPPPRCSQVPHPVPATCVQRRDDDKGAPPPPPPHTSAPPRGCARRVGGATTGDTRQAPPLRRDKYRASCPRHACVVPATCVLRREDDKAPPPPHTPPPTQGWGMQIGGGEKQPPPPRTKRQGGEAAARGCGTDHTTVPEESRRRASPSGGATGGANAG